MLMKSKKTRYALVFSAICIAFVVIFIQTRNEKKEIQTAERTWVEQVNLQHAWKYTRGNSEIIVGIIDSGIDISCNELVPSIFENMKEIPENGVDDDKNGFQDDYNGWNFYDNEEKVFSSVKYDYHGTTIASIISGYSDENLLGVAPLVKILPLKCFRGNSGNSQDVVKAIQYGYSLGVRIFNCSWTSSEYNQEMYDAIKRYSDCLFVCASGNDSEDMDKKDVYPASYELENVVCVGGVNVDGELYEYAGHGKKVDIYAPAENICVAFPNGKYDYVEGTSFATAFVSGTLALMQSINKCEDILELKRILIESSNTNLYGYPVLDIGVSVENIDKKGKES